MLNKNQTRSVVSFRADSGVTTWVGDVSDREKISRSAVLERLLEPALQKYVNDDNTLVCIDESIKGVLFSQLSFRAPAELITRVEDVARREGISRSGVLGLLFSAASKDTTLCDFPQENVVLKHKNKSIELNPANRAIVKKVPLPFKAAVKEARITAGLDEGKGGSDDWEKKHPGLAFVIKCLEWGVGVCILFCLVLSGKSSGGSPKLPGPKGSGGIGNLGGF